MKTRRRFNLTRANEIVKTANIDWEKKPFNYDTYDI